jgi:DNA-binding NarL/FixJ family response regulator
MEQPDNIRQLIQLGGEWIQPTIVADRDEIAEMLVEMERSCQTSVDILAKGTLPLASAETPLTRVLDRGIRVRCIYERQLAEASGAAYLERWRALGEEQRVLDSVPIRAAVVDRSTVVSPVAYQDDAITALLVIRAGLGEAVAQLFDILWNEDPARPRVELERPLSGLETEILTLMCDGASDLQIARALGISGRTVQRRLRALTQLLDAQSRAALAARAVAYGLVRPFSGSSERASTLSASRRVTRR